MPINPDVVGRVSEPVEDRWTSKDCILYGLGVGAGQLDPAFELEFTTENTDGRPQRVLPTFVTVLGHGGSPVADLGRFDPAMMVHGEQAIELHGMLPPEGAVSTTNEIVGVYDKGSGALVVIESVSKAIDSGEALFTKTTSLFIRGEGGFGGDRGPSAPPDAPPDRRPDELVTYGTRPDQALLYRLSGDRNPLHSDPSFAKRVGFDRPILHGLCTFGFTGRALLHTVCESSPDRFGAQSARFSRPAFPGDTLEVAIWVEREDVWFRTSSQRGEVLLDRGRMRLR